VDNFATRLEVCSCYANAQKGARNLVSNYRPVSLTAIFSMMMESFIKDLVMSYLTTHNLVFPYQFGFMQGRSYCIGLYHFDEGYSVEMICLDFQTAIHIQHLIHKLASTGLQGNVLLKRIKSFISNRTL